MDDVKRQLKAQQGRAIDMQARQEFLAMKDVATQAHTTAQAAVRILQAVLQKELSLNLVKVDNHELVVIYTEPGSSLKQEIVNEISGMLGGRPVLVLPKTMSVSAEPKANLVAVPEPSP